MSIVSKSPFYIVLALSILIYSCKTNKSASSDSILNTKSNWAYEKSTKGFYGRLDDDEYRRMLTDLERELEVSLPEGRAILINYSQKAPNCIAMGYDVHSFSRIIDNRVRISFSMTEKYDVMDFFVFSEDVFHREVFEKRNDFKLDSGFFFNNIFTLHENCEAVFILKPNKRFFKYYGEDYFTVSLHKFLGYGVKKN